MSQILTAISSWFEKTKDMVAQRIEATACKVVDAIIDVDESNAMVSLVLNKYKPTKIAIGWGDWGLNPNLNHSAPTPGIGLRRRDAKHFWLTFTVPERNTSKTCPCCRTVGLMNPKVGKQSIEKHHLLRCPNEACQCRWWDRNIAGYFNILYRAYENLYPDQNP